MANAPGIALAAALPKAVVRYDEFEALVAKHNATTAQVDALEEAGYVVRLHDCVHCHPSALALELTKMTEANEWDPCAADRAQLAVIELELEEAEPAYRAVLSKASRTRKALWSLGLGFSGVQLAGISRLTFFDLEWDVMEPISYFLGTGTSLCFFVYMMRFGVEHSNAHFDTKTLRKYAVAPEVQRYAALQTQHRDIEARIAQKMRWCRG